MRDVAHFILYVADQTVSTQFYARTLAIEPRLNVAGMTEFGLGGGTVLGLMPEVGIKRLLGAALPDPAEARGVPRAELYLHVNNVAAVYRRAIAAGARELSPPALRGWGHFVAYVLDPDSHVVAFATAESGS
jgi:uncharacterized protein